MTQLARVEYPPTPFSAAPRQAETDEHLVELWLHGRSRHTRRAYRADSERFRTFVAKPLAMVTHAGRGQVAARLWSAHRLPGAERRRRAEAASRQGHARRAHPDRDRRAPL